MKRILSLLLAAIFLLISVTAQAVVMVNFGQSASSCAYTDCFDRTNGGLGSNWTTVTSQTAPNITASSKAIGMAATGRSGAYYNATAYNTNQRACVDIIDVADTGGVAVRVQSDVQTMYLAVTDGTNLLVRKLYGGSFSTLATYANVTSGDRVCLSASGDVPTTLNVTVNGTSQGSTIDPSSTITGGAPGIEFYSTTATVDNFFAENL